jgi:hypothetical protein
MLRRVAAELRKIGEEIWATEAPMVVFGLLESGGHAALSQAYAWL